MSAVYLLTADSKLWKQCKKHIEGNRICFDAFKPVSCTEIGYTGFTAQIIQHEIDHCNGVLI